MPNNNKLIKISACLEIQDNFIQWLLTPGCFLGEDHAEQACCLVNRFNEEGWYYTDIKVY